MNVNRLLTGVSQGLPRGIARGGHGIDAAHSIWRMLLLSGGHSSNTQLQPLLRGRAEVASRLGRWRRCGAACRPPAEQDAQAPTHRRDLKPFLGLRSQLAAVLGAPCVLQHTRSSLGPSRTASALAAMLTATSAHASAAVSRAAAAGRPSRKAAGESRL